MPFVAFQQYDPVEHPAPEGCIWCGKRNPTNRSHIVSRKLAPGANRTPTLHVSVCTSCNSACGKLEEWVLRYTPLSWLRFMLYLGSSGTSDRIPSYFFSESMQDWVVFHFDGSSRSYVIVTQLLNPFESTPTLLTPLPREQHNSLLREIASSVASTSYLVDVRPSLPEGFSPRFLLDKNQVILVARTEVEASRAASSLTDLDWRTGTAEYARLGNSGRERHHFRWSKENWARFCAKAALEALCLFEGGTKCLSPAFRTVRRFVIDGSLAHGREIRFDQNGPVDGANVPVISSLDLTNGQNAPQPITAVVPHCDAGVHAILVYEAQGWVLASVVFAGFPAAVLVLGGPDEHLADFYQLIYDDQEGSFDFVRLAYDQERPFIPLRMSGDMVDKIAETYGLKPT